MRLRAISTIHYGTPRDPKSVEAGTEFNHSDVGLREDEAVRLVKGGHAVELNRSVAAAPASAAVVIPPNWKSLPAGEQVELAKKLGAGKDVDTGVAAAAYIEDYIAKTK